MATPDILDHGRRIAALERKVSEGTSGWASGALVRRRLRLRREAKDAVDQPKATYRPTG
jgi:hypothetical protein